MTDKFIYALIDPISRDVRYIGATIKPECRLDAHMDHPRNSIMKRWIDELKANELKPELVIIDKVDATVYDDVEVRWIKDCRAAGCILFNKQVGGGGVPIKPSTGYKTCSKCKRDIPATTDFFTPNKYGRDGLRPECNECRKTGLPRKSKNPSFRGAGDFDSSRDRENFKGNRMRDARRARRLTQGYIAKACGISLPTIANLEIGSHDPSIKTIVMLSKVLGVTVGWLMGTEDDPS